jgi:signal transduction histidine kinase
MKPESIIPFPHLVNEIEIPLDGNAFPTPVFCKRTFNHKCIAHYRQILANGQTDTCPYGFGTDVMIIGKKRIVVTALSVSGISNKKLVSNKYSSKDVSVHLTREQYEAIKNKVIGDLKSLYEFAEKKEEVETRGGVISENQELLDTTFHELRKLNTQLKRQAELLSQEIEGYNPDTNKVQYLVLNIYSTSRLISIRLNSYDFLLNPELNAETIKKPTRVFKKIEKVMHCLRLASDEKGVRINLKGTCHRTTSANDLFELLPFILLENALKYSPRNDDVEVKIVDTKDDEIHVKITSRGPRPNEDELDKLFEKGFRSKRVEGIESGSGFGLFLAQAICELNSISIEIKVGDQRTYINQIAYSDFIVVLKMKAVVEY